MNLEQDGVVILGDNKTCKVHGICTVRLKMFDDCNFILYNVRYIPMLKQKLLSISMFGDLDYCIRVEHVVLKISHCGVIISKGSKICGIHI